MPEPDWIASPLAAELEDIIRGFRDAGKVAEHVTLVGLLDSWCGLVEAVERGYEDSVDEYANAVDSRAILDRVGPRASSEARNALLGWLRPWDARYEAATWRAAAPFHGAADSADPHVASRWHWRIPRRLIGELKSDLRDMGLA